VNGSGPVLIARLVLRISSSAAYGISISKN
jgi:hypothetical protein